MPWQSPQRPSHVPAWPPSGDRPRWPVIVALLVGTVIGAAAAALASAQIATHHARSIEQPSAVVTVTAATPQPTTTPPLPAEQANRATCNAWHAAGDKIRAAAKAQSVIPKGMTILDQAVKDNPEWAAAVGKAADLYDQASDTLAPGITPGATTILSQAARGADDALHTLSTAYATFDVANGNAYDAMHQSSDMMDVLCERLAPR